MASVLTDDTVSVPLIGDFVFNVLSYVKERFLDKVSVPLIGDFVFN